MTLTLEEAFAKGSALTLEEVIEAGLTLTIEEVIEDISRLPGFISVEAFSTPDFLTNQLEITVNGETIIDTDTTSIKMVFQREKDDVKTLVVVINNQYLKKWPSFVFVKNLPDGRSIGQGFVSGIIYCDCDNGCKDEGIGTFHNKLRNMGEPPTFYYDPTTSLNRRIYSYETEPLPELKVFAKLKEKIEQIPEVEKVLIERSRVSEIDEFFPDDTTVVITPILKKASYMLENFPDWKNHLASIAYFGLKTFEELETLDLPNETFDGVFNKIKSEVETSMTQAHEFFADKLPS